MHLYVDGALQSVFAARDSAPPSMLNTADLKISEDISPGDAFHGKLDDMRVYNRALGASEINHIYYGGS